MSGSEPVKEKIPIVIKKKPEPEIRKKGQVITGKTEDLEKAKVTQLVVGKQLQHSNPLGPVVSRQKVKLDILVEKEKLRTMYLNSPGTETANVLLLGEMGSGKTHMAGLTAPLPILFHTFDPGATKLAAMRPLIESGDILVDNRYEGASLDEPKVFNNWQKEFNRLRYSNFFDNIGTFVLDSFTTWVRAFRLHIADDNNRTDMVLEIKDWQVLENIISSYTQAFTSLPCHVILTGHLSREVNEVTGREHSQVSGTPGLQKIIPLLFDEIWAIKCKASVPGGKLSIDRKVLTMNDGSLELRTRIGGGTFEYQEEPDFRALLRKAGMNYADKVIDTTSEIV